MPLQLNYATPVRTLEPRWLSASCFMAAASALAVAINVRDGEYWPSAILLVSIALPLALCGAFFPRVQDPGFGATVVTLCPLGAIATQLLVYEHSPAGGWNWWSDD